MSGTSLLITCHPNPQSLCGEIARAVTESIRASGRTLIHDDLDALGFNPVVEGAELKTYMDPAPPADVALLAEHLRAVDELIFVFPVWMYAMPARLKGYFDRVWRPHVSFDLTPGVHGGVSPLLFNVRHLCAIASHGMGKADATANGDGTALFFDISLPSILPNLQTKTRFDFYDLDFPDASAIQQKIAEVSAHLSRERGA